MTPQEREEADRPWRERRDAQDAKRRAELEQEAEERRRKAEEHHQWLQTSEGQAWSAKQAALEADERVRTEVANWKRDYLLLGVITRLAPAALEGADIQPGQALEHAREYVRGGGLARGEALTFLGGSGGGKSFAATAVLRAAAGRGSRKFIYFPGFVGALLDPGQRKAALQEAKDTWLVVIDEIGLAYVKKDGLVLPLLEEIIFVRHGEYRPTVITSNLTNSEFKTSLSDRIIDRLKEWGPVFNITDPSFRQRYDARRAVQSGEAT